MIAGATAGAGPTFFIRGRPWNPPINPDEWIDGEIGRREAGDADERRRDRTLAAGAEVRSSRFKLEAEMVNATHERLTLLRREIVQTLVAASDFRRFQLDRLLADVDAMLERTRRELVAIGERAYKSAAELGEQQITSAVRAGGFTVTADPGLDDRLVNQAFENTAEMLTEPMQIFRREVAPAVRRIALGVDNFGDNMLGLARSIQKSGMSGAEFKAERILRTELGRTFNGSTFERLLKLSDRMPMLRKIWIRTKDGRTRATHVTAGTVYARGSGIKIAALFHVGSATMRFCVDPLAAPAGKIAARETIMCRCNNAVDYDLAELRASTAQRVSLALGGAAPVVPPTPIATPPAPAKKPRAPKKLATPADIRKKVLKKADAARAAMGDLATRKDEAHTLMDQVSKIRWSDQFHKENAGVQQSIRDAYARAVKLSNDLADQLAAERRKQAAALRKMLYAPKENRGKLTVRFQSGERFSTDYAGSTKAGRRYEREDRKRIAAAIQELSKMIGTRTFGKGGAWQGREGEFINVRLARNSRGELIDRAHASWDGSTINVKKSESARTVVHEVGHLLEMQDPKLKARILEFYDRRTAGEALRKMSDLVPGSTGYEDHEVSREDKFLHPYMGKDYNRQATELVSMGVEYLYADPETLARKDPEFFDFLLDLLRGGA